MYQEKIDSRYVPTRSGNGLMYGGGIANEMQNENMPQNSGNSMANTPAGENDRRNMSNAQTEADGSVNVLGFTAPPPINFDTEEMRGSIQFILSKNIGEYVVVEFLIGTSMIVRKQGVLYYVGTSYITLYDNQENNFIVCDVFSVKFVYFFFPGDRPDYNYNVLRPENASMQPTQMPQNNNATQENMRRQQNMRR